MLLVAPSNFHSARRSARFGAAAKTAVASEALTSFGVRGTSLRTSTAHDLARSVVTSPHVAVAGRRLLMVLSGNPVSSAMLSRRASETLAAIEGAAQSAPPSCPSGAAAAEYGYRCRLLLASATQTADPWRSWRRERGAGRTEAGAGQVTRHRRRGRATRPNPSLKWTRNGRPPWPGLRYAVHFLSPGQGVLPLRAP